jgi:hypothetical protein
MTEKLHERFVDLAMFFCKSLELGSAYRTKRGIAHLRTGSRPMVGPQSNSFSRAAFVTALRHRRSIALLRDRWIWFGLLARVSRWGGVAGFRY